MNKVSPHKMSKTLSRSVKTATMSAGLLTLASLPVFAQNAGQLASLQDEAVSQHTETVLADSAQAIQYAETQPQHIHPPASQPPVSFAPLAAPTRFSLTYTGSLFFLPIGVLDVTGNITSRGYSMRADMKTRGVAKLTKSGGLWATSIGFYDDKSLQPSQHVIQKLDKRSRRTEISYDEAGNPDATHAPAYGSLGEPPATADEQRGALDVMSAITQLMMSGHKLGDEPCSGHLPVFDGKRRYNLRLEDKGMETLRQSSYRGEALHCNVYMDAISGYDLDDIPTDEEASAPLEVYLVNFEDEGLYVPVRFDYRISGVKVNIRATKMEVTQG